MSMDGKTAYTAVKTEGNEVMTRSGLILNRNLRKYLLPSIATAIAISLDEFVDSIIVANVLGPDAMTIVNLASPAMLIIAAIYILLGVGGSSVYALSIGQRDSVKAGKIFSVSLVSALLLSLLLLGGGMIFISPLCSLLCGSDASLMEQLVSYIRVLLLSAPLIIGVQVVSLFFPAAGSPGLTTAISITANAINLICDYLYLKVFSLGINGAAWATVTGYSLCLLLLIFVLVRKKVRLYAVLPRLRDFRLIGQIAAQGAANSVGQVGFAVKYAFFNNLALSLGGSIALQVFTVCIQLISIMSIGLEGVVDAVAPFAATLRGQKDYSGIRFVLRWGAVNITVISVALTVLFELFPGLLYRMFNVTDPEVIKLAGVGIRIFLVMFLIRGITILFMIYSRLAGHRLYSVIVSLMDGFALLIPVAAVLSAILGLTGIWLSFPVTAFLLFFGIFVVNRILVSRSRGRLHGFFLLENEPEGVALYDMTISENDENITRLSTELTDFCLAHGTAREKASRIGLIAEEMAVYTRRHRKSGELIDVMARVSAEEVTLEFRGEGTPFDPFAESREDVPENIALIRKLPSKIDYDYILGMNSTRFVLTQGNTNTEKKGS